MKLRWTPLAVDHLKAAYEYIASNSPTSAERVIQRILSAVELLQQHPDLGRSGRVKGTRELIILGTPFLVPYRLRHEQIEILAVFHASRCWPSGF